MQTAIWAVTPLIGLLGRGMFLGAVAFSSLLVVRQNGHAKLPLEPVRAAREQKYETNYFNMVALTGEIHPGFWPWFSLNGHMTL
jgi:hypothetical protein